MTDFTTEAGVRIPDRELRDARERVEDEIGSVAVSVDADTTPGGGGSPAALAGGAGALDELDEQTEVLHDIHDELEAMAVSGAGGGGGGGGGLLDGMSGFTLGSLATGGGGVLSGAGAAWQAIQGMGASGLLRRGAGTALFSGEFGAGGFQRGPLDAEHDPVTRWLSNIDQHAGGLFDGVDIPTPDPADIFPQIEPPGEDIWPDVTGDPSDQPSEQTNDRKEQAFSDGVTGVSELPEDQPGPVTDIETTVPEESDPTPGPGGHARITTRGQMRMDMTNAAAGYDGGPARVQFGSETQVADASRSRGASREPRVDVQVQEIAARIEGRTLRDALSQELQNITPEIEQRVLDELEASLPNRR